MLLGRLPVDSMLLLSFEGVKLYRDLIVRGAVGGSGGIQGQLYFTLKVLSPL